MKKMKILSVILALAIFVGMLTTLTFSTSANSVSPVYVGDDSATNPDSATTDQNYNLTLEEGKYTDVTKVKIEWTLTDINVVRKDAKVWDPDQLKWVDDDENDAIIVGQNGSAKFTLTNLSSVKIQATATFETAEYETGKKFSSPTILYTDDANSDGEVIINTVVGENHAVADNAVAPSSVIGMTIKPVSTDFKTLASATGAKYGTYTITISEYDTKH